MIIYLKKRFICFITLLTISTSIEAFQCPTVMTNITFTHVSNGQQWVLNDENSIQQGWYIQSSPAINNRNEKTVNSDASLYVYLNSDNQNNLYVTCEYYIGNGSDVMTIPVTLNKVQGVPTNNRFINITPTRFLCKTTANRPDLCASQDIQQRPVNHVYN